MKCQTVDVDDYFAKSNLTVVNKSRDQNRTLTEKLRVIKRCVEEREFAYDLDIVRQVRKISVAKTQMNSKKYLVKDINLGSLQIINNVGDVVLNKAVIDLSILELSNLLMIVEKPISVLNSDKLLPIQSETQTNLKSNINVKTLSIITSVTKNKISKINNGNDVYFLRNNDEVSSNINFPESLSLTSNNNSLL